jgi:histidinol-phosphate aminotransferase
MTSIWAHANPALRELAVYEPGKPIEETARELGVGAREIVKLASNENPLGPSPKAIEAMRKALGSVHRYPDGGGYYLRNALTRKLGVGHHNLILGNGSNEIIEFLGHAFLGPGSEIVASQHAFIAYKLVAATFGASIIETPSPDYHHHLDEMVEAITPRTRLLFVANPNNPTGTLIRQEEIDRFIERMPDDVVVVFDEAYFEYVDDPPDTVGFVREDRNVIVLRTFSKIAGLAGIRVGYGIARVELIEILEKTREPFNTSSIGQIGALAALDDAEHFRATKVVTDEGRAYLEGQFAEMGLPFVEGTANFVLLHVGDGQAVFKAMLTKKIIVRALKGYQLPEWVRVSIGTMEQNRKCVAALQEVLGK